MRLESWKGLMKGRSCIVIEEVEDTLNVSLAEVALILDWRSLQS